MLLLTTFEILLNLLPLHLLLLLLLQLLHRLLLLLLLLPPPRLLRLQLLHPSLSLLLLLHNFTHPPLVLLLRQDLLELHLKRPGLLLLPALPLLPILPTDLLVKILNLLHYSVALGLILQLACLLVSQSGRRRYFFGKGGGVLSEYGLTGAISSAPFLSPWATLSAEVRVMPLASCSVKLVTSRPFRY